MNNPTECERELAELHWRLKRADRLATAVLELIDMGLLDTRSKAGDALLAYCGDRMKGSGAEAINEFRKYVESTRATKEGK